MGQEMMLLHVCCAPCLAAARATLARDTGGGFPAVAGLVFYNPNIHPLIEFRRRVKALRLYLERNPVPAEINDNYGLRVFLERVHQPWSGQDRQERCRLCYQLRLGETARRAALAGYAGFSSTLLASREQDRDLVAAVGQAEAERYGIRFYQGDLRRFLPDEKELRGIYRQQYCGCIFSEEERYRATTTHLYRSGGPAAHPTGGI
ncbi:MAG: epoxyqueuosine reductase QueH [Planctomycetes bacterium]|nr:epoxyqueuosine reductase QueH [Planctomycetota bacterium]